jgi:polyisoprenyl-teichoic acid--peptidoglycan teichoic acid transferase
MTARRTHRWLALTLLLLVVALVVPPAARVAADSVLLKVTEGRVVDRPQRVVWILALGSDARPGQSVARSRADSIHLVGVNGRTRRGVVIGVPRDAYVDIPGHGRDKINSSTVYGGPRLAAQTVHRLTGIRPDYVFLTHFGGLATMVHNLGGVQVRPPVAMNDLGHSFAPRRQWLDGREALAFSRIRYGLPRGDFDRSLNQGRVLKAGLVRARTLAGKPGRFEGMLRAALSNLDSNVSPIEMYRLGRLVLTVEPARVRNCVIPGGTGSAGGASVVFLDRGRLAQVVRQVRRDATLKRC